MESGGRRILLKKATHMATAPSSPTDRKRPGVRPVLHRAIRIDMTPMVDLGFLLITFFVITARMSAPTVTHLAMPKDGPNRSVELGASQALTILAGGDNKLYYFAGSAEDAIREQRIHTITYAEASVGGVIRAQQELLDQRPVNGAGREGLMLLIKAAPQASYKNLMDLLDEALINGVKKYAVLKMSDDERALFNRKDFD